MGVKNLWTICTPLCERKPLYELQGKTIAIDLSCWVMDSQFVIDNAAHPKFYLRNLCFRTANLLLQDIFPVFVLEGKAPVLKHKTMARRMDAQQLKETGAVAERKTALKGGRSRFNGVLRECEEMLNYMGLKCVQGYGEAEAMCAYLNEDGLVDGCISQDSDCFLYGAKTVYRNFSTSSQGSRAASGGCIDVYEMTKIEKSYNMGRNKMIALALLCGCDYNDGLDNVGRESAMKLFQLVNDEEILKRLKSWKTDKKYDTMMTQLANPNLCTSCGHQGKIRAHAKSGCTDCRTLKGCSDAYKEKRKLMQNEITLRKKAAQIDDFPNQELIDEYLIRKGPVPSKLDLKWKQPRAFKFLQFMEDRLGWEPEYSFEKIFPLMTRWQILHLPEIALEQSISFSSYTKNLPVSALVFPKCIKKIRNIKSVASYEISWKDEERFLEGLVSLRESDKENSEEDDGKLISIEPQSLFANCYPEVVERFEEGKKAKKRGKGTVRKVPKESEGKEKKEPKKRKPRKVADNKKIDDFPLKNVQTLEESFEKMGITPKRLKKGPQFEKILQVEGTSRLNNTLERMFDNLSVEDFASEGEELDMSEIIDGICSKKSYSDDKFEIGTDVSLEKKLTEKSCDHETTDEFADLENYVPLSQRIKSNVQTFASANANISLGIEDLLNETTDEFADLGNYVPLSQRIRSNWSLGIEELLNESSS